MQTGFSDPIKIRKQTPRNQPVDGKNSPWDYRCPHYDERSSCFVNAGTKYGVGHKQPVGRKGIAKQEVSVLPLDRRIVTTMKVDEV